VIDNLEIAEIARTVQLGVTPIAIYDELRPEHLTSNGNPAVVQAFQSWITASTRLSATAI
jgi:hypothetical protein